MKSCCCFRALALLIALCSAGCQVGKDSTLFVTKTSFGVDVDGKPPTLGVGYDRKEGVVSPKFADGQVIPQMASFRGQGGFMSSVLIGAAQSFAVGEPATIMSKYMGNPGAIPATENVIPASELSGVSKITGDLKAATTKRYFFGTDTNLGVNVHLAAESGGMPTSLSVGWKRKEIAYVPLENVTEGGVQKVVVPSLIATTNFAVNPQNGSTTLNQFFATGVSANYLAAQPDVRAVLGGRIFADDEVAAGLQARKEAVDAIRTKREEARAAKSEITEQAKALIDQLPDGKLDSAHQAAVAAGITDAGDNFSAQPTPASKREYLKKIARIFDEDAKPYQDFTARLKKL